MKDAPDYRAPQSNGSANDQISSGRGLRGWLRKVLRPRNGAETLRDTIEELIEQEDAVEAAGADELIFLRNVLNLRHLNARDVMVPRVDIVAVDVEVALHDLIELIGGKAHSRMPVFRDTLDDVIGMVHIKDVMAYRDDSAQFKLSEIVRRLLFVAPTMPILELLLQMRASRTHMALVVDEFGGIDGLITIEDLVEEIVGEIEDEHDADDAPTLVERSDGSFDIDARLPIPEFEQRMGAVLTDEERDDDIDTLGGLVFAIAGRVPGRGEVIRHESGIEFEILEADPRRIKRLRINGPPNNAKRE
jgi:CBS domain containing-hemolysin-like protein